MSFICVCASMLDWFTLLCMQGIRSSQQDISTTQKSIWVAPRKLRYPNHLHPLYTAIPSVLYGGKPWNRAPSRAGFTPFLPLAPWDSELGSLSLHFSSEVTDPPLYLTLYHIRVWSHITQEYATHRHVVFLMKWSVRIRSLACFNSEPAIVRGYKKCDKCTTK